MAFHAYSIKQSKFHSITQIVVPYKNHNLPTMDYHNKFGNYVNDVSMKLG